MLADFKFESEECEGCVYFGGDFPSYLANAPLCVPVTASSSVSSGAVIAGCLANISTSITLTLCSLFRLCLTAYMFMF